MPPSRRDVHAAPVAHPTVPVPFRTANGPGTGISATSPAELTWTASLCVLHRLLNVRQALPEDSTLTQ